MASYDLSYSYDGAGNRLAMVDNFTSALTSYSYDPANQLLASEDDDGITSYLYDPDGNRTRKETPVTLTEYEYDDAGRMALAEPVSGAVSFAYNGRGQRVRKETPTESKNFLYDFERLLHEYDGNDDSLEHEYTFGLENYGQLVSEYDEFEDSDSYYTYDAQWSTDALLDEDEFATNRYQYRAFGLQQTHVGSSENPFTFVGKQGYYRDPELDFYFLGMSGNSTTQGGRFYDPDAGRFVTQDPLGQAAGDFNYYRYVRNNPINVPDPSGLAPSGPGKPILNSSFKDSYWWFGRSCHQETALSVEQIKENFGYLHFNYEYRKGWQSSPTRRGSTILGYLPWASADQATLANASSLGVTRLLPGSESAGGGCSGANISSTLPLSDIVAEAKKKHTAFGFSLGKPYTDSTVKGIEYYLTGVGQTEKEDRRQKIDGWWAKQSGTSCFGWGNPGAAAAGDFAQNIKGNGDIFCKTLYVATDRDVCNIFKTLYTNCTGLGEVFGDVVDWFPTLYAKGPAIFRLFSNGLENALNTIKNPQEWPKLLTNAFTKYMKLSDFGAGDISALWTAVLGGAQAIGKGHAAIWKEIKDAIPIVQKFFKATTSNFFEWLKDGFGGTVPEGILMAGYGVVKSFFEGGLVGAKAFITETFSDKVSGLLDSLSGGVQGFLEQFNRDFLDQFNKIATNLFTQLAEAVGQYAIKAAKAAISGGATQVLNFVLAALQTLGNVCGDISEFMKTIMGAFKSALSNPSQAAQSIGAAIVNGVTLGAAAAMKGLDALLKLELPNRVKKLRGTIEESIQNLIKKAAKRLRTAITDFFKIPGSQASESATQKVKGTGYQGDKQIAVETYVGVDGKTYLSWNPVCTLDSVNEKNPRQKITACTGISCSVPASGDADSRLAAYEKVIPELKKAVGQTGSGAGTTNNRSYVLCCPKSRFGSCFVTGTPVHVLGGIEKIEELTTGQPVVTGPIGGPLAWPGKLESRHRISLVLRDGTGISCEIELLRSADWIADCGGQVGGTVWLNMPEMGVEGEAEVLDIGPARVDDVRPGSVTGTFRHSSGDIYDLKLESEAKPIGVTGTHPFWSVDREDWVSVLDLEIGETVKTLEGTTVVESLGRRSEPESVYNIEVEGDHVYRVGESGVLVHNASAKLQDFLQPSDVNRTKDYVKPGASLRKASGEKQPLFTGYRNLGALYYKSDKDSTTRTRVPSTGFVEGTSYPNHAEQKLLKLLPSDGCPVVVEVYTERYPCKRCDPILEEHAKKRNSDVDILVYFIAPAGDGTDSNSAKELLIVYDKVFGLRWWE